MIFIKDEMFLTGFFKGISSRTVPEVCIPLRSLLHINPIMNKQFFPLLHLPNSDNSGYLSIARVEGVGPLTVRVKTMVYLVCKGGGVVGGGLVLKYEE